MDRKMRWPSGLRRWFKAPVCKGEGSNPSLIKFLYFFKLKYKNYTITNFFIFLLHFFIDFAKKTRELKSEKAFIWFFRLLTKNLIRKKYLATEGFEPSPFQTGA